MFITCPNCNTRFSIPDGALGVKGRTLKCAKCAHKWFQSPIDDAMGAEIGDIVDTTEISTTSKATPIPMPPPAPPEKIERTPEKETPPPPPPPPPPPVTAAVSLAPAPTTSIDSLNFDDLDFGLEEKSEPVPMMSGLPNIVFPPPFVPSGKAGKTVDFDLLVDEIPEGGLPSALKKQNIPKEIIIPKKSGLLWACVGLTAMLLAVFGAYVFQQEIIQRWPQTALWYEKAGLLQTTLPGAGLAIVDQNINWLEQDKTQALIVRGTLVNLTTQARPFPAMVVDLYAANGLRLQTQTFPPQKATVAGSERYNFRLLLSDIDPLTTGIRISFVAALQPTPREIQETKSDTVPDPDVVPSPVPSNSDPDVVPTPAMTPPPPAPSPPASALPSDPDVVPTPTPPAATLPSDPDVVPSPPAPAPEAAPSSAPQQAAPQPETKS